MLLYVWGINIKKKTNARKETRKCFRVCNFRLGLSEKVTFKQRFEGGEWVNACGYLGRSMLDTSNSRCKGLKVGFVWHILDTFRRSVWLEWNEQWESTCLLYSFLPLGLPSFAWVWKIPGKESDWLSLPLANLGQITVVKYMRYPDWLLLYNQMV